MINIFLVEDHDILREGISALLQNDPEIAVIGEASNGQDFLYKLRVPFPDVVVMDINMPEMNGIECTKRVKKLYPSIKVLILSMHDHENYLIDMLNSGANGYILKNSSRSELLFAIKKIANDGMYISPEFTMSMLAKYMSIGYGKSDNTKADLKITDRELEVLQLISEGHTNSQMANTLVTSMRTIETRRKSLLDKTNTTNTATLIRFAVLHGLIK